MEEEKLNELYIVCIYCQVLVTPAGRDQKDSG
jgi:hypothetical protein